MTRVNLPLPESYLYKTSIAIRIADVNYGGHTGNDSILTIAQEARLHLLTSLGYKNEIDLHGCGMIVADAALVYKSESFYGDVLDIYLAVEDHNKYGFDLCYSMRHKNTQREVARVKTGIVFISYETRKLHTPPVALIEKLNQLERFKV